jgi:hypothetical protein
MGSAIPHDVLGNARRSLREFAGTARRPSWQDSFIVLSGFAVFPDVLVIAKGATGWAVDIEGHRVSLARTQIAPGTTVPEEGQRGPLNVAVEALPDVYEAFRRSASKLTGFRPD